MNRTRRLWLAAMLLLSGFGPALAQNEPASAPAKPRAARADRPQSTDAPAASATTAEDDRERLVVERFLSLLEKTPRKGTALDRVYGYHVERGSLDAFVAKYEERVEQQPDDGAAWLILGMVESQRGRDASAVAALRKAEKARPDDPLPSYYLGQSLVLVGQPDEAALAFERAIARKPSRNDLLEIFQALGRVHQRAQRKEQALEVWNRLEAIFPDDLRVQEQIAQALVDESQFALALPRLEKLAGKVTDDYRKIQLKIDAADLKLRLGKPKEALADLEGLLAKLNPESWLYRDVRRRVEDVFLRSDDQAGLAAYYESWLKKSPEDVDAMARLGRTLALQGRASEAQRWFDKAVKLAPSKRELRLALVEQLVLDKKYAEAAAQYEAMARNDPANPDIVREWGRLVLRDPKRPAAERKAATAEIWRKLLAAKPNDAATAVLVADLFRKADMADDAIALYQKAIALAPGAPQYREYLGEYYHTLKRSKDALATWAEMATGLNRTAKNLGRLAEVEAGFGYKNEAIAAAAAACALEADSFELQLQYADLLQGESRFEEALAQLGAAAKAAADADQREAVLDRQIACDSALGKLPERIAELQKEAGDLAEGTALAEHRRKLARYFEAAGTYPEAIGAIRQALAADGKSVPSWTAAARLYEAAGNLSDAADALRMLADLDRRSRTEYLTRVARIEARLGRSEQAIKAGRDLLAAAPGNLESYEFFAELCFQLGKTDEGLDALRRAVRLNDADAKALLALAETLAQQFRTEESIEMYWRAFDKANELDAKLGIVSRLTALYLQRNQFDRLIARLERQGREAAEEHEREAAICLAQAYASSGDFGAARQKLERLLAANTRDAQLLKQLSTLAENEGDVTTAAKYARQMLEIAPNDEGFGRLAQLYVRAGEIAEAEAIWTRMASGEPAPMQVLLALDSLATNGKYDAVLEITGRRLRTRPGDWEALYREGAALAREDHAGEAMRRFRALLALNLPDDTQSEIEKARRRASAARPLGATPAMSAAAAQSSALSPFPNPARENPVQSRLSQVSRVRAVAALETRAGYPLSLLTYAPLDFGQARLAALAWLAGLSARASAQGPAAADGGAVEQAKTASDLFEQLSAATTRVPADVRQLWDLYYLRHVQLDFAGVLDAAKALSKAAPADPAAQWAFLMSVPSRALGPARGSQIVNASDPADTASVLAPEDLDQLVAAYKTLRTRKPEWSSALVVTTVANELKRARRAEAEQAFYDQAVASANDAESAVTTMRLAAERGDLENLLRLFDRYDRLRGTQSASTIAAYTSLGAYYTAPSSATDSLARAMCVRADAKAHGDVLRILDHYLATLRRPDQAAQRTRARGAANASGIVRLQIWTNKQGQFITVDFPTPNAYLDIGAIQLLREAFVLFQRDDLTSDLLAHWNKDLASESDTDRVYARLALGALDWWADEKDDALRQLSQAAEAAKGDPELLLSLAELRMQRNEPEEALSVADSFEPLDQRAMQRRELLALRLAVLTGDVDRARRAAERLFGLRLEADTQTQLAAQMHQLGMHEMAEAILGRARRRAGNNTVALAALMTQYQRQNNVDVAVQIAHQILSRGPTRQVTSSSSFSTTDQAQQEAINVLARSGKLKEMTERVEAQLARTPGSAQLMQLLADYYQAAGDKAKVKATYEQMIKARPDDARLRMQVGQQLARSGDTAGALEHYKAAIQKEPALLDLQLDEVMRAFQQERKLDDFVAIIEQVDLRSLRQSYRISSLLDLLMQDKTKRERGLALFRKAWKELPDQRESLLVRIREEDTAQLPELYDFLEQVALPRPDQRQVAPWFGVETVSLMRGNGLVSGPATMLLQTATRQGKLDALAAKLEEARKRLPGWRGGQALLALVEAKRGRVDAAKTLLEPIVDDQTMPATSYARIIIGQEIDEIGALEPLALRLYEAKGHERDPFATIDFQVSPIQRLIQVYQRAGRSDDARRELLKFVGRTDERYSSDPGYAAYRRTMDTLAIGQKLVEIGYAADAVRIYSDMLADTEAIEAGRRWNAIVDQQVAQLEQALLQAVAGLGQDTLGSTLRTMIRDGEHTDPGEPGVDLVLLVQPRTLDQAQVTSVLARSLAEAARSPEVLAEANTRLERLIEREPKNVHAQVASALVAFAAGKQEAIDAAVARLARAVDRASLEPLARGARANARQRKEAAPWLSLWLVARECAARDSLRPQAEPLAARALEAARRQTDPAWTLAMLREQGQLALDRGDRAGAEARWTEMLTTLLAVRSSVPAGPATTGAGGTGGVGAAPPALATPPPAPPATGISPAAVPAPSAPARATRTSPLSAPAAPARNPNSDRPAAANPVEREPSRAGAPAARQGQARPSRGTSASIMTLDRFQQVAQVARLAARSRLDGLAQRAVSESLRGGPPVVPITMPVRNAVVSRSALNTSDNATNTATERAVEALLAELDALWLRNGADASAVYETLRDAVLPPGRPAEIFLYPRPLGPSALGHTRSAGSILARWAGRAGRIDELRQRIALRQEQPMSAMPALVLLALIDEESHDDAQLRKALHALADRLDTDTLQTSAELACHAALPALERNAPKGKPAAEAQTKDAPVAEPDADTEAAAIAVLERAIKNLSAGAGEQPAGSLRVVLARHQFSAGRVDEGRQQLRSYAELLDRAPAVSTRVAAINNDIAARKRSSLQRLAAEYARAGLWADALDLLGQYADTPMPSYAYDSGAGEVESLPDIFASVARQLAAAPAAERYELLRDWTLPGAGHPGVRILAGFVDEAVPAPCFERVLPAEVDRGLVSSPALLIAAARAAGQLDELAALVQKADEQNVPNADVLWMLAQIARGQAGAVEPRLVALAKEWRKNDDSILSANGVRYSLARERTKDQWPAYLLTRACLMEPQLAALAFPLAQAFPPVNSGDDYPFRLRQDIAAGQVLRESGLALPPGAVHTNLLGLHAWAPSGLAIGDSQFPLSTYLRPAGAYSTWWVAHEGHISRAGKPSTELLVFAYPLAGRFEVSVDLYVTARNGGSFGYGGWMFAPSSSSTVRTFESGAARLVPASRIAAIGRNESFPQPAHLASSNGYTRLTIAVEPGKVRYSIGGVPCYEDNDPSPASPFLVLGAWGLDNSDFRNLQLHGTPEIPREVALVQGDQLAGWSASFYGETQPAHKKGSSAETVSAGRATMPSVQAAIGLGGQAVESQSEPDWQARQGVIEGRRVFGSSTTGLAPSLLAYYRPLFAGETVRWEFSYEPGVIEAHPALGQTAFLIEQDSVRLRWLVRNQKGDWTGLPPENAIEPPGGKAEPRLHKGEWNQAQLSISADGARASLEVNGTQMLVYPIEPTNDRTFGFYHDKSLTSARVRNIVLSGPWPQAIAEGSLLAHAASTAEATPLSPAIRRTRHALVGEELLVRDARAIIRQARSLPAAERYAFLSSWVLPSDDHPAFRLAGDFTPTDLSPAILADNSDFGNPSPRAAERVPANDQRTHTGGQLEAPALALVAAAKEAGRLGELADRMQQASTPTALDRRGQLALLVLVHQAQGQVDKAAEDLAALVPLLAQLRPEASEAERWPELVAATSALELPALRGSAQTLAEAWNAGSPPKDKVHTSELWQLQMRHLAGLAALSGKAGEEPARPLALAQDSAWVEVTHAQAASRGAGAPLPLWSLREGTLRHDPGHYHDFIHLRTPLHGEFELTGELVGKDGPRLVYGGVALGLIDEGKSCEVSSLGRNAQSFAIDPPLDQNASARPFRLVAGRGSLALYVDGRRIREAGLPASSETDPWLAIYQPAGSTGAVRKLALSGKPAVAEQVDLMSLPELTGWLADYYGEATTGEDWRWAKRGDVIIGRAVRELAGTKQESLLRYHRPLLEDDAVEYEFFYEPGRTLVHPALDRLVLLLEPDGVRVHWLTDGPFDRTGLAADNATVEKNHKRGPTELPLRPRAWNSVRITIAGDLLTLSLNGQQIFERPIEPANDRTFGLFHYADETEARVRKATLRGAWGKTVPASLGFEQ